MTISRLPHVWRLVLSTAECDRACSRRLKIVGAYNPEEIVGKAKKLIEDTARKVA